MAFDLLPSLPGGPVPIGEGGTGATDPATARANLSAAKSGANSDITSLTGLSTPLPITEGGTGASTASGARSNLSAAQSGVNADITSLTALSTPLPITEGGTGSTTASGARTALLAASSGTNSDITSLTALSTPIPVSEGGTGATTAPTALSNLGGVGGSGTTGKIPKFTASSTVGDSSITQSGSDISVGGIVESTSGGFKFPDATIQTTAAGNPTSGMILLETQNPVNAASFIFATTLTAGVFYKVTFRVRQNSSAGQLRFRFNHDSGGTNYRYAMVGINSNGGGNISAASGGTDNIAMNPGSNMASGSSGVGWMDFGTDPSDGRNVMGTTSFGFDDGVFSSYNAGSLQYAGASSLSALSMSASAGSITGEFNLYKII